MAESKDEIKITTDDKRKYILRTAPQMSREARTDIIQWVAINARDAAWDRPAGAYVNLARISDHKIDSMYAMIKARLGL